MEQRLDEKGRWVYFGEDITDDGQGSVSEHQQRMNVLDDLRDGMRKITVILHAQTNAAASPSKPEVYAATSFRHSLDDLLEATCVWQRANYMCVCNVSRQ